MSFALLYWIATLPCLVGAILYWKEHPRFHWSEWLKLSVACFAITGLFHIVVAQGMTVDEEIWSGEALSTLHIPAWTEHYLEAIYRTESRTDSQGRTESHLVFSHYESRYDRHPPEWWVETTLGDYRVDRKRHDRLVQAFGSKVVKERGDRTTLKTGSSLHAGDPYDYLTFNQTDHIEPVVAGRHFENRVKASPSVFSYEELSEEESQALPEYPYVRDPWRSGRVIGSKVSTAAWDRMLARLGPQKRVNLILVHLKTAAEARRLEAKWVGGKKNDLVLCFGPSWSYVFGWCEDHRVRRELETLLVTREVNDTLLPAIEAVVREHYTLVDWSKFDYLDLRPRTWHLVVLCVVLTGATIGILYWAHENDQDR